MRGTIVFGCVALLVTGCTAHQRVSEPSGITLSKAMRDTVDALAAAREQGAKYDPKFGFYPCTVTAVFNVSATGTADNKTNIGVSGGPPPEIAPVSANLSVSNEETESGTRGNTVTLVFATKECLPQAADGADRSKTPEKAKNPQPPRNSQDGPIFQIPNR
jgi:hypothetical protein